MDIFELCGITLSTQDKLKVNNVIDWAARNVILQRALDKCTEQELPYSLISIIEDSDCDTYGTIRLWLSKQDISLIDNPLTELSELPNLDLRETFDGVCDKLKELSASPVENKNYFAYYSMFRGQYDVETVYDCKLSENSFKEILDGVKAQIEGRIDTLGIGHQPQ